ncbi:sulfurtransferase TusA family protein [Cellulomonas sp. HZM]|uniref:sulfurtransferase TusA family protein n=1 Tax=Cellulomonas sp. HZM TaxID=1454010 RepID=UPI0004938E49|nr:sulfurtransferase TusA family protein [Cellulomonas sp. HZM]
MTDLVVDATGLRCPAPVIRLARAAREARPGTTITVLATDPAAEHDVPAWARMRGHALVSVEKDDDRLTLVVRTAG